MSSAFPSLSSATGWLQRSWYLLFILAVLSVMTLLPKIPLFEIIPGYIVRARAEDILVLVALFLFGIQLIRRKATLVTPLTGILVIYTVIGILSMLNAMFLVKSLPLNFLHVGKMVLHFLRRLEYMSLFFIFYSSIKKKSDISTVIVFLCLTVLGITIYGYGQKYLYWPVYSTMNREFSKGVKLVLTEHARVPSTFGGHYDMSAYVMVALTLLLAAFFFVKNKFMKLMLLMLYAAGFWLLILGSSRSSFLGYLLSVSALVLFIGVYKKSLVWMISRGIVVIAVSMFVMVSFGDLSSRFSQLGIVKQIQDKFVALTKPVKQQPTNTVAINPLDKTDELPVVVATPIPTPKPTIAPKKTAKGAPIPNATSTATTALPPDVYVNVPDYKTIIVNENGKLVQKTVAVQRQYSDCTYVYGLSACIRFDTLWPRAIKGFLRNPFLGSGYSTLTKSTRDEFTEAESTDNDFLRNLGETGIFGVLFYYGPMVFFIYKAFKVVEKSDALQTAFLFGLVSATLGLFMNAMYIDVFEASKVAFMYWSVLGVGFAIIEYIEHEKKKKVA